VVRPAPRHPQPGGNDMSTLTGNIENSFWKRLGMAGFVFFLVKGLAWLAVPVVMYLMGAAN
jgi:hypothetical protein